MHVRARHVLRGHRRLSFGGIEARRPVAGERDVAGEARRGDARDGSHALEHRSRRHRRTRRRSGRRRVRRVAERDADAQRQHRIGIESGVQRGELLNTADHQPGADEQHDRERHLGDDERASQPLGSLAAAAARRLLQRVGQARHARVNGRRKAEQDAAGERDGDRKQRDAHVHARLDEARKRHRARRHEHADGEPRDQQTGNRTRRREHASFGDELTQQPRPPGAERRSNGDFTLPRLRSRDEEVRHVGARDEEHEGDRRHQSEERGAQQSEQLHVERAHVDRALRIRGRVGLLQAARDRIELGLRARKRDAGFQPREHDEAARAALGEIVRAAAHHERHPGFGLIGQPLESRRHDAHDRERPRAEAKLASDDLRIAAEPPLPQTVAQHGDGNLLRDGVFIGPKRPPTLRVDAEQREVRRRHIFDGDAFGLVARRENRASRPHTARRYRP